MYHESGQTILKVPKRAMLDCFWHLEDIMTQYIIKAEGKAKKNVALINSASDIPAHLEGIVTVADGKVFIRDCIEGSEVCPVGNFIAWEQDESTKSGWNIWCKSNGHSTLYMKDGQWFEKPKPVRYEEVNWTEPSIPDFMKGANIEVVDGKIVLHALWGDQDAKAKDGPYAFLAYADGSYALLKLSSDSAKEYFTCDAEGNHTGRLIQ